MYIERLQVEEGFLDGLDVEFVPGLNVIIGTRGTGKTSLIELIRYVLADVGGSSELAKRSRDHAISILQGGQATITLRDGDQIITVSRSATDKVARSTAKFSPPIVFSQTEIENIGLEPQGRLRLIDGFLKHHHGGKEQEQELVALVRSVTSQILSARREIDELTRETDGQAALAEQLASLSEQEESVSKSSLTTLLQRKRLEKLSEDLAKSAVAATHIRRFMETTSRWRSSLLEPLRSLPPLEPWPTQAGTDEIREARSRANTALKAIRNAVLELEGAREDAHLKEASLNDRHVTAEEQARQVRREIEVSQTGAGVIIRQAQQLRERLAQIESLKDVLSNRLLALRELIKTRDSALDTLDNVREERFNSRLVVANQLNKALGPRINIALVRSGQFDAYTSLLIDQLRGSGLRYADLAPLIAENISPRELAELAETANAMSMADTIEISLERAARILSHLKESDIGVLSTVQVEDDVILRLLDGSDQKEIGELSTGQRCTIILPLILRHTDRILVVDQPEDHIDNAFIADTLIRALNARGPTSQMIFSTHNANIPVLGEADRIVQMDSDGKRGFVAVLANLNDPDSVKAISNIMEGGAKAFETRARFYKRNSP